MSVGDYVGKRFGRLTVLKEFNKNKKTYCNCECDCGNVIITRKDNIAKGATISCGCADKERKIKSRLDLTGQRFGRLVAVKRLTYDKKRRSYIWEFKCDCGNVFRKLASSVKIGNTQSCGCIFKDENNIDKALAVKTANDVEGTNLFSLQTKLPSNNTSGHKGVGKVKIKGVWSGKWHAKIWFKGEMIWLGTFDNIDDAIEARKKAEEFYFKPIIDKYKKE